MTDKVNKQEPNQGKAVESAPEAPKPTMMPVRVLSREDFDTIRDAVREAPYKVAIRAIGILDTSPTVNVPVVKRGE